MDETPWVTAVARIAPEKSPETVNISCVQLPSPGSRERLCFSPRLSFPWRENRPALLEEMAIIHSMSVKVSFPLGKLVLQGWGRGRDEGPDSLPLLQCWGSGRLTLVAVSSWQESSLWPGVHTAWLLWHVASNWVIIKPELTVLQHNKGAEG